MSFRRTKWIAWTSLRDMGSIMEWTGSWQDKTQGVIGITVVYCLPKHSPTRLQFILLVRNSSLGEAFPCKSLNSNVFTFSHVIMKIGWKYWSREGEVREGGRASGRNWMEQPLCASPLWRCTHSTSAWGKCFIAIIYFILTTTLWSHKQVCREKNKRHVYGHNSTRPTDWTSWLWRVTCYRPDWNHLVLFSISQKPIHSSPICRNLLIMKSFLSRPLAST